MSVTLLKPSRGAVVSVSSRGPFISFPSTLRKNLLQPLLSLLTLDPYTIVILNIPCAEQTKLHHLRLRLPPPALVPVPVPHSRTHRKKSNPAPATPASFFVADFPRIELRQEYHSIRLLFIRFQSASFRRIPYSTFGLPPCAVAGPPASLKQRLARYRRTIVRSFSSSLNGSLKAFSFDR